MLVDYKTIEIQDVIDIIKTKNDDLIILDVRTKEEFDLGNIDESINIDVMGALFADNIDVLDKNKTYLIYCKGGKRSKQASDIMFNLGFKNIYNSALGYSDIIKKLDLK